MIRAIIVEDEYHPRETLKQKLQENHSDVEIIMACDNAENALVEILRHQPDLIFLDIQLPGNNGLWLADQLLKMRCESFTPPGIIFTTAYTDSEYLLNAIKVAAIDYLIKPIPVENLALALERFRQQKANKSIENSPSSLIDSIKTEKFLSFKNFSGLILLKPENIAYIEADGNYSVIFLANGETEDIYERLGEIEKKLSSAFIRLGKSIIVNYRYVRQIDNKHSLLKLITPQAQYTVEIPRNYIRVLKEQLEI